MSRGYTQQALYFTASLGRMAWRGGRGGSARRRKGSEKKRKRAQIKNILAQGMYMKLSSTVLISLNGAD